MIDPKLLNLKAHFFFLMAGTAPILPIIPVYAIAHLGLSYNALGLVYTILPIVGLFVKILSGSLSDWFRCHRATFLSSIAVSAFSFFCIYFLVPIPPEPTHKVAHVIFDCSEVSYLRYNIPEQACGKYDKLNLDDLSTCEIICNSSPETVEYVCKSWNITSSACPKDQLNFSALFDLRKSEQEKNAAFFPVKNLSSLNFEVAHPHCFDLTHLNCTAKCDNDALMSFLDAPQYLPASSYSGMMSHYEFWLFLGILILANSGFYVSVVMTDTVCFQMLGTAFHKYGKQRMFGSIGWGTFAILTGLLIDVISGSNLYKNYTPMFFLSFFLLTSDFLVASKLKVNVGDKAKIDGKIVLKVLSKWRNLLFVLCCIVIGHSTGVLWTYQLILVQTVAYKWDCNFVHIKLLQGLIMGVQCFGGELPFFFISGAIIKKLGHFHSMSLAILSFGLLYVLYFFVSNPWLFLPLELFGGFSFGIFYSAIASYANIIAPQGAQATLQGIFGASFEGLGVALGAFIGAALFTAVSETHAFLYIGIFNVIFAICHLIFHFVVNKCIPEGDEFQRPSVADGYIHPGESLKKTELSDDRSV